MVGKWSADHLPSTYRPPKILQRSFKDPSRAPSTQVFFMMHCNKCCWCLLCDRSNRFALNSYFHNLQCTDHLPSTYRPLTDHIPTTSWPHSDHFPTTFLRCSLFNITVYIYTKVYSRLPGKSLFRIKQLHIQTRKILKSDNQIWVEVLCFCFKFTGKC